MLHRAKVGGRGAGVARGPNVVFDGEVINILRNGVSRREVPRVASGDREKLENCPSLKRSVKIRIFFFGEQDGADVAMGASKELQTSESAKARERLARLAGR